MLFAALKTASERRGEISKNMRRPAYWSPYRIHFLTFKSKHRPPSQMTGSAAYGAFFQNHAFFSAIG
jgi:hypothetical protein